MGFWAVNAARENGWAVALIDDKRSFYVTHYPPAMQVKQAFPAHDLLLQNAINEWLGWPYL